MGTWGVKIFDNDISKDIKADFKYYLAKGFDEKDATDKLCSDYDGTFNNDQDEDYQPFWIALAITKWELGRLDTKTKEKAIEVIDNSKFLEIWNEDDNLLKQRIKVLSDAKIKLLSNQPAEKKVKRIVENICPYQLNDIIYYKRENENYVLFMVKEFSTDRGGKYADCFLLDYNSKIIPTTENIKKCKHIQNVVLLVWSGRLYNKLVKDNRFGIICNYEIQRNKEVKGGYTAGHLKYIETILNEYIKE